MEKQGTSSQTKFMLFVSQFLQEFQFARLLPALIAGGVIGSMVILVEISFAALIFSGELSAYVSGGIGFMLLGGGVMSAVVALTGSNPGTVMIPQDTPVAILALMATAIASNMPASATSDNLFFTVVAAMAITSLLTGICFFVLGIFQLGNLIRFIPYPVVGGFLAGTGWLLVKGGLGVMTDMSLSVATFSAFFQSNVLLRWVPGTIFGLAILIILRRYSHFLIMPIVLLTGIGVFYLVLWLVGMSFAEAGSQGWMLGPFPEGGLWKPLTLASLPQVHWSLLFQHIGSIGTILLISVISLLLNAGGIELVVRRDMNLNRDLRSAGVANVLAGLGGSPAGYHALSFSVLGHKLGANSRFIGLISSVLCGMIFFFGSSMLSFFPKPILGGLLVFLGVAFLTEWVYDVWFTLPKVDYMLVLLILGIVGAVGFLQGVVVGILVAVILFAINYSRIQVIKHILSGATYHSNVERAMPYQRILSTKGNQLLILKLQGFLFFGTAHNLLEEIRQRVTGYEGEIVRFLVFDCHLITGMDSSAINSMTRMKQMAEARNINLVMTGLLPHIRKQFTLGGFIAEDDPVVRVFPDLDHGVEWCEEQILKDDELTEPSENRQDEKAFFEATFDDLMQLLDQQEVFETMIVDMMSYFERQDVEIGEYLIHQGDPPDALYFIESGQVSVQLEHDDGRPTRLRTMNFGTIVGELGFYQRQPASASVVVQEPGTIYRLSIQALRQMTAHNPEMAAIFHRFMAYLLAERLIHTTNTLKALQD